MSVLRVKDLTKEYKTGEVTVTALRDVTLEVEGGEFIVILGPSGSGKSTLLNIIGGMDRPSSGEVYYRDQPIHQADDRRLTRYRRKAVGFVFQFYNLLPNLTAVENIRLAADLSENPLNPDEILRQIELDDRAGHFPSQLSGGQQQRVAIARAVAKNPDILLCDEPIGALDFSTGLQVLKLLREFNKAYQKAVLIITHNSGIAHMADRVFYLRDGRLEKIVVNENPLQPEEVSW